jgi:aerobic-type carbon monoxide dehydrogenase small subunit (CoxS/CutS family)
LRSSALTTAGAAVAEAASLLAAPAAAAEKSERAEAGLVPITLSVNGVARSLAVEPRATLAETLRSDLGLTGTKISCDRGACGACTVWLDFVPVSSCMMLAVDVGPRQVTTIEGLTQGEALHPVQAAFIAHDALQCGFCTPGMVMSCAALLEQNPDPSAEEVKKAIAGHLCRCGCYPHVISATLAAAKARRG